jgi:hypothetical protein
MKNKISRVVGGALAILGAVATLSILVVAGLRMGDRLIYHVHLEGFSLAERRCQGLGDPSLADTPERHKCLRAELAKIQEPVWEGTFPLFLAAVSTSVLTVGGLAMAIKRRRGANREQQVKQSRKE